MKARFVHCTVQSEFSRFDSTIRIDKLVAQAVSFNLPALGLTDKGVLDGVPEFMQRCQEWHIQPIVGCKFLVEPESTFGKNSQQPWITLLAKDRQGYQNLCHLVSAWQFQLSNGQTYLQKCVLEAHHQGLIALSSGYMGEVSQLLLEGRENCAKELTDWYRSHFEFYLELQDCGLASERSLNPRLKAFAEREKLPLLVTQPVHVLHKQESELLPLLHHLGRKRQKENFINSSTLSRTELHLKSPDEMIAQFWDNPEALQNTLKLAEQCSLRLTDIQSPRQIFSGISSEIVAFRTKVWQGIHARYTEITPEIQTRLQEEITEIIVQQQTAWFVFLANLCAWMKNQKLVFNPLWSNQGALLVSYALGLSDLDPLTYQIKATPGRILGSTPEFTINLAYQAIKPVQDYIQQYWGSAKTAQSTGYIYLHDRDLLEEWKRLQESIAQVCSDTSLPSSPQKIMPDQNSLPTSDPQKHAHIRFQLNGLVSEFVKSPHAVLISQDNPLADCVALRFENQVSWAQIHRKQAQCLGLSVVNLLEDDSLSEIGIALNQIPLNEKKVYQSLSSGEFQNLFWIENNPYTLEFLKQFQPSSLNELTDLLVILRPRPIQIGIAQCYLNRKQGKEPLPSWITAHETLLKIFKPTQGLVLYQDQIIELMQSLANFSPEQAERFRLSLFKSDNAHLEEMRARFILATDPKLSSAECQELLADLINQCKTSFIRSHALGKAVTLYCRAYLRLSISGPV